MTQYLHHLQEHIALGGATQPDITSSIKNGDGSAWSLHNSQKSLNTDKPTTNITTSYPSWSNFNPDYEQLTKEDFGKTIGKNVAYTKTDSSNNFDDDSQLSFSKNGTEIEDSTTENIQDSSGNNDFFTQNCKLYNIAPKATESPVKTHRSSSLTPSSDDGILFHSNENLSLLTLMQKPRSYSLSSEHNALLSPHNSLISSGSESRLDDFKNSSAKTTASKNAGMTNIAQWLKSLRLHKYIWLFSNTSYEDMMAITEEYLARLGVTKGARHKLYLSIQRLKVIQIDNEILMSFLFYFTLFFYLILFLYLFYKIFVYLIDFFIKLNILFFFLDLFFYFNRFIFCFTRFFFLFL